MRQDLIIIVIGTALLALVWVGWSQFDSLRVAPEKRESVFCAADVRECPDGSYVSRIPPHCAFAACPGN